MNLLYINTHDTGRIIQPYGIQVETPALTDLSKDGTLFTHAYCCSPTCSPSRASLLCGTYPHQNGMLGLAQRGFSLNEPQKHLANFLKNNGYDTAISGIQHEVGWYLDLDKEAVGNLGYQNILTTDSSSYAKEDLHKWDRENVKSAIQWLNTHDNSKPFMLSYGMHSTHRPYPVEVMSNINPNYTQVASTEENNEENRKDQSQFLTSLQYADENIGLLIDALKQNGLFEDTLIIYTTDHGVALPFHKCNLTDAGIGVSLIMRNPKAKSQGIVVDSLVSQLDIFPTICDILDLNKPYYLEGVSFSKMFEDKDVKCREQIFAEVNFHTSYEPIRCIRTDRYKYIKYFDKTWDHINCSNMDESIPKKFLMDHELESQIKQTERLYDCYYDPNEMNNLVDDPRYCDILDNLKEKMNSILENTNDPIKEHELEVKSNYKVNKKTCLNASSKDPLDYDDRGRC